MPGLGGIWEKRKLPKTMAFEERARVVEMLRRRLGRRGEVLLALLYGGFLHDKVFRDIDIAIYTGYKVSYDDEPRYVGELSEDLETAVNIPVDIKLLDYAPPRFQLEALEDSQILVERIPGLRSKLIIHAYEDLEKLENKQTRSQNIETR